MILLDTHVLVRYLAGDIRLGKRAVASIDRALHGDELFVSAITFWELAMLVGKGRLELETSVSVFRTFATRQGIQEEPIDGVVGIEAAELPDSHGDPADRILVATALLRGLTLVTADEVLLGWKLKDFRTQDATA